MRLTYSIALYLLMPLFFARFLWRGRRNPAYWRRLGERFGFGARIESPRGCLWIHAVSVGEAQAAVPIVQALRDRYPEETIVATSMTPTGAERILQAYGNRIIHRYFPFDLPGSTTRFLNRVNPRIAIIMETELWPNMLASCRARGVPVVLANIRISERSAAGYRKFRRLFAPALSGVSAIAVQSREDARRISSIGAPPNIIDVTGSTKFDVRMPASLHEEAAALRRVWGIARGIWIAASTHEGEEEQILDAFQCVLEWLPETLLTLVPRHPERFGAVAALVRRRGFKVAMRSRRPANCADANVFIGDTMGELPLFYAASDVAFVGGTLVAVGGHNMLEPAALGLPVLLGPHVFNFADISRRLVGAGGAEIIEDSADLCRTVRDYLQNANQRYNTGEKGRVFVKKHRGARDRVLAMIEKLDRAPVRKVRGA